MRNLLLTSLIVFLAVTVSAPAAPAPPEGSFKYSDPRLGEHKDVSDKFKFVRIQGSPMYAGDCLGDNCIRWSHDYPEAGRHFSKILTELSKLQVVVDEDEYIFSFADPNLFKYPFAYLAEVGDLELSEDEIKGLREYVLRGGFLLIDDFRGQRDMSNFEYNLKKALPEFQMKELDVANPIFNCFFSIKSLDVRPVYRGYRPQFFGLEDKNGRLMMV
ncbi:MAG TPA: DUF4159 domain-containing protein, partial [Blastocatellia bacterium]|nr:DUF4159 domain-containing protein [Blastocatellia bacterium]